MEHMKNLVLSQPVPHISSSNNRSFYRKALTMRKARDKLASLPWFVSLGMRRKDYCPIQKQKFVQKDRRTLDT